MNKHGQSIVEYALIAILVILGIYFMGTYVLRSINGHFKLWDVGVQDTFNEKLQQAPANSVPIINETCQCTVTSEECGGPGLGCAANYKEVDTTCNLQGCGGGAQCVKDQNCCSALVSQGCGSAPCPSTGCPNTPTTAPLPAGSLSPCYYGYQVMGQMCGGTSAIQCQYDLNDCALPICIYFNPFPNSTIFCANNSNTAPNYSSLLQQGVILTQSTNVSYVQQGSCPSSGATCQAYCVPPYVLTGNACQLQYYTATVNACTVPPNFPPGNTCASCPSGPGSCDCDIANCYVTANDCGKGCTYTYNDESFTFCSNSPINSAVAYNNGCGNPGQPDTQCNICVNCQ